MRLAEIQRTRSRQLGGRAAVACKETGVAVKAPPLIPIPIPLPVCRLSGLSERAAKEKAVAVAVLLLRLGERATGMSCEGRAAGSSCEGRQPGAAAEAGQRRAGEAAGERDADKAQHALDNVALKYAAVFWLGERFWFGHIGASSDRGFASLGC
jgi:hypothetical protein